MVAVLGPNHYSPLSHSPLTTHDLTTHDLTTHHDRNRDRSGRCAVWLDDGRARPLPPCSSSSCFRCSGRCSPRVHDYTLINPGFDRFTGAANYRHALGDPEFRHSLRLTAFFVVAVVTLEFLIGFTVALMLNAVERVKTSTTPILLCRC